MTPSKTPPPAGKGRRPTIENADVPSDTLGLPGVGEGASARHFARDVAGRPPGGENDPVGSGGSAGPHVPPLPPDEAD